ncbi:hypothetical protein RRG08_024363 [Elysia crispata]|uniref:Uncharacterized protein n=1 Tax=Elysia crispata TaxID=231223 RepID=A0AAE1DHV4_9GAST|nr:hypothetical protein RRG08_024363 [Elysia crispata]
MRRSMRATLLLNKAGTLSLEQKEDMQEVALRQGINGVGIGQCSCLLRALAQERRNSSFYHYVTLRKRGLVETPTFMSNHYPLGLSERFALVCPNLNLTPALKAVVNNGDCLTYRAVLIDYQLTNRNTSSLERYGRHPAGEPADQKFKSGSSQLQPKFLGKVYISLHRTQKQIQHMLKVRVRGRGRFCRCATGSYPASCKENVSHDLKMWRSPKNLMFSVRSKIPPGSIDIHAIQEMSGYRSPSVEIVIHTCSVAGIKVARASGRSKQIKQPTKWWRMRHVIALHSSMTILYDAIVNR